MTAETSDTASMDLASHLPSEWDGQGPAVAVCGDWHANTDHALKVLLSLRLRGIKRVLHVGDFGFWFRREYLTKLSDTLAEYGMHLWFIDGNHDDHDLLASLIPISDDPCAPRPLTEQITYLPRGARWTWDGLTWLGVGGAPSIDRAWRQDKDDHATKYFGWRPSWWEAERITDEDIASALEGGHADVVVTHDAPEEVFIPLPEPHFPEADQEQCRLSRERLQRVAEHVRPSLWLFGHYHQGWAKEVNGTVYRALDRDTAPLDANVEMVVTEEGEPDFISLFDLPTVDL